MMLADERRFVNLLKEQGLNPIVARPQQFFNEAECLELVGDIDGWLAGDDQVSAQVIDKAMPRLKVISKWGTGLDSFDLAAAEERGLPVCNTPAAFKDAVAEIAIGYMLELARHIGKTNLMVRRGKWPKIQTQGLVSKTLGLIGYGAIGQAIATRASSFQMPVKFFDPFFVGDPLPGQSQVKTLEDLLSNSDYVCLACNLSSDNHHLINQDTIAMMKNGAFLVNVARGPLVDEAALITALEQQHLAGAGLDVFEVEPLPETSALRGIDTVILGSHNANNVASVVEGVHQNTLNNLYHHLKNPTSNTQE